MEDPERVAKQGNGFVGLTPDEMQLAFRAKDLGPRRAGGPGGRSVIQLIDERLGGFQVSRLTGRGMLPCS